MGRCRTAPVVPLRRKITMSSLIEQDEAVVNHITKRYDIIGIGLEMVPTLKFEQADGSTATFLSP